MAADLLMIMDRFGYPRTDDIDPTKQVAGSLLK